MEVEASRVAMECAAATSDAVYSFTTSSIQTRKWMCDVCDGGCEGGVRVGVWGGHLGFAKN